MRKHLINLGLGIVGGLFAFGVGFTVGRYEPAPRAHHEGHWVVEGPECPTEDSCAADYANGQWSVTEVTP